MLPTTGQNKLIILGSLGSGKTSSRLAMWCKENDISNVGPTLFGVEYSGIAFCGETVTIEDYSGSDETWSVVLSDKRRFQYVRSMIFYFDASKTDYQEDLDRYQRSIQWLIEQSPEATVSICLHKADLIRGDKNEALRALKLKIIERNKIVSKCQIDLNLKFKYFVTSIHDYSSISNAWRTIILKLVMIPQRYIDRLQKFAEYSNFDQLALFNGCNQILIANIKVNPAVTHFTNDQCQERSKKWFEQKEIECNHSEEDGKSVFVHDFIFDTVIVAVSHDSSVTALFANTNFRIFLINENKKSAARYIESVRKEALKIREWKIQNCPFELNEDMKVKDYKAIHGNEYFKVPQKYIDFLHDIAIFLDIDQVFIFNKEFWVMAHMKVSDWNRCYKDFEWVQHVEKWLGEDDDVMHLAAFEFEDGRKSFRVNVLDDFFIIFVAAEYSELSAPYINEYIKGSGFHHKLECLFKNDYYEYND
uniref:Uncharacterized protein n=1 Tax=Caenorhabditis tropicalis TaxID=1561998 RepID=A0A1I7UPV3_9PELO